MSDSLDDSPASLTASRFLRIKRRDCSSSASCKSKSSRFRAGLSLNSVRDEKPYENALVVEFGLRGIPVVQQRRYDVLYKTIKVGEYVPDLIVFDSVVVDAKVIEAITDHERGQMLNYLRISGLKVGVILNFKHAKLEWERLVLNRERDEQPRMNANEREFRI
jgi:GxxExxY protein